MAPQPVTVPSDEASGGPSLGSFAKRDARPEALGAPRFSPTPLKGGNQSRRVANIRKVDLADIAARARGNVIGESRVLLRVEHAEMGLPFVNLDAGTPGASCSENAKKTTGATAAFAANVLHVLAMSAYAQVGARVVQAIAVEMVDNHAARCVSDDAVHVGDAGGGPSSGVGGPAGGVGIPPKSVQGIEVRVVNRAPLTVR